MKSFDQTPNGYISRLLNYKYGKVRTKAPAR
jgi:hypothetical protein